MNATIGLAFLAGLASFLSPCVFALVPVYVSYLSGRSINQQHALTSNNNRLGAFLHGIAFVLGFSAIFILLGLTATILGRLTQEISPWIAKIGGAIVILFGLQMIGVINIPFLDRDFKPQTQADQRSGYLSSFLMGVVFSAGWTPCTGPVLGAIFMIAMNIAEIGRSIVLLGAYSLGLSIPFLITAMGVDRMVAFVKKHERTMRYVEIVMGIILIIFGIMLFMGTFQSLARLAPIIDLNL